MPLRPSARVILAILAVAAPAKVEARKLPLSERVALARAVEAVYAERRAAEGATDRAADIDPQRLDAAALGRVERGLRAEAALAEHFGRPLTDDAVAREMTRIASVSRRPDILRDLWAAVGDDPALLAEIVVRPALAERLARRWYARDVRLHAATRAAAERALESVADAGALSSLQGARIERQLLTELTAELQDGLGGDLGLSSRDALPGATGRVGALLEDDDSFFAMGLVMSRPGSLEVVQARWEKTRFDDWLAARPMPSATEVIGDGPWPRPPLEALGHGCSGEGWDPVAYVPEGRSGVAWTWTGTELVIWGGLEVMLTNWGDRYDPALDRWTPMTTRGAPSPRSSAAAAWTGSEVIVWGGAGPGYEPVASGARYSPATDSWMPMTDAAAPEARFNHRFVWTGTEAITWGGTGGAGSVDTGGRYDPAADAWTPMSPAPSLASRSGHAIVWTGSDVLVWGGCANVSPCESNDGALYDPLVDAWRPVNLAGAPVPRRGFAWTWTGTELFVWGGCQQLDGSPSMSCDLAPRLADGGLYDPASDSWRPVSDVDAPHGRAGHTAVWTGSEVIIWGGCYQRRDSIIDCGVDDRGRRYDPVANAWFRMNTEQAGNSTEVNALAVWSGSEMIVWRPVSRMFSFGKRYSPASDSWVDIQPQEAPSARRFHTGVYTGAEVIIWGGLFSNGFPMQGGASYDLALDEWTILASPVWDESRQRHVAVWTGREMIAWGGTTAGGLLAEGGIRFEPATRTWLPVQRAGAPSSRIEAHVGWTGTEMLIWGNSPDPGGFYDPAADSWRPVSEIGAPAGRYEARSAFTGSELLVWGGWDGSAPVGTGGRYDVASDTWSPMSAVGAPSPRLTHEVAWTGDELVVFGGQDAAWQPIGDGARWSRATDTWMPLPAAGAPSARYAHGLTWNGTEVVAWGGCETLECNVFGTNPLRDAAFDPISDSWRALDVRLAPEPRSRHVSIKAGEQVFVWSGQAATYELASGALYCGSASTSSPGIVTDLHVSRATVPGFVDLAWTAGCSSGATDYAVYRGEIGRFGAWTPERCSTGGALAVTVPEGSGTSFFVVVPRTADVEGGPLRPTDAVPCLPRHVPGACH